MLDENSERALKSKLNVADCLEVQPVLAFPEASELAYRELLLKIMEMRKKGVSEEMVEMYEASKQQVEDEVKELDAAIAEYEDEITKDDAQEKSND